MCHAAFLFLAATLVLAQPKDTRPLSREILTLPPPSFDHRISYGVNEFQFGHLRLPKRPGPHPVVVVIHGGFWRAAYDLQYAGHMAAALTAAGVATWNIEYRRIGHLGGGYPGTLDDVAAALDHLPSLAKTHSLDLSRVVAIGHSAGGHLALWLATRQNGLRLRGVVTLAGVTDLQAGWERKLGDGVVEALMGGTPQNLPDQYRAASPIANLPIRMPVRLIHGALDQIVPVDLAVAFSRQAKGKGDDCRLIRLKDAGHFELVDPRTREWQVVLKTTLSLLR